jgi:quercetin dioxygenase-like cupin family protein
MCDKNHKHQGTLEQWITPEDSTRLRSKLVQLSPGATMPEHTTGPGREEVITCIFGTLRVTVAGQTRTLTAGQAAFIPPQTLHSLTNPEEDHALYSYVVNMR